jgi:peroxiredoxin
MKIITTAILACCSLLLQAQVKIGQQAPEISLPNTKGVITNLSSFKGKVVLIDFWASWCGPCRASNPKVVQLYNKYKANGFEVFGVSIDSKKSAWVKAIAHDKLTYTQVNDSGGWNAATAATYGVEAIPSTFLIDKEGKIVAIDIEGALLSEKIKDLLAK